MTMTQPARELAPIHLPELPREPLFSVLIRNYNYENYVSIALDSLLRQTYTNFEAVVCDDGSTDRSVDIIQGYERKDPRIKLVRQENGGPTSAANTAFASSKGELVCFLDADDVFRPSKLERVLATFRGNPRCGHCADRVQPISSDGERQGHPFPDISDQGWAGPAALKEGGRNVFPPMSGLSFRRDVLSLLLPMPLKLRRLEDYYLSATARFLTEVTLAPECLTEYRIHGGNRSGASGDNLSSCLSPFDPQVHQNFVERLETVVPFQQQFLRQFYGPEVAEALRIEDNPRYWYLLLTIRVLRGKRSGTIRPFSDQEMIRHVSGRADKRLWRALTLLPHPLAAWAYRFWRSPSQLKSIAKAAVLPLIRR